MLLSGQRSGKVRELHLFLLSSFLSSSNGAPTYLYSTERVQKTMNQYRTSTKNHELPAPVFEFEEKVVDTSKCFPLRSRLSCPFPELDSSFSPVSSVNSPLRSCEQLSPAPASLQLMSSYLARVLLFFFLFPSPSSFLSLLQPEFRCAFYSLSLFFLKGSVRR